MSHSTGIPDDGDEQERSLTLNEVQEALADESHPLHERAKRENAQIATDLSGAYLNMIRRTDAAAADAFAGVGRAAADALSRVQVDLSHLQEPWAAPHSSGLPPDFDYSVPQFEVAVDPTPAKLDEMIEVGRNQHEAMARMLLAADESAKAAKQSAEDGQRYGRRSLIAAWVGIGAALLIGIGSIVVTVALNS